MAAFSSLLHRIMTLKHLVQNVRPCPWIGCFEPYFPPVVAGGHANHGRWCISSLWCKVEVMVFVTTMLFDDALDIGIGRDPYAYFLLFLIGVADFCVHGYSRFHAGCSAVHRRT